MNQHPPGPKDPKDPHAAEARHGYRNEVNWEGGSGRQPYANQGPRGVPSPVTAHEEPEGNRRERSGRTQDQLEQLKKKS